MASWSSAFAAAFKILVMSIIWYIVGFAAVVAGAVLAGATLQSLLTSTMTRTPYAATPRDFTNLAVGVALLIIGFLIMALGSIATFLKYSAEFYAREILRKARIPPPPP